MDGVGESVYAYYVLVHVLVEKTTKKLSAESQAKMNKKEKPKVYFQLSFFVASITPLQHITVNNQRNVQMPTATSVIRNCFPQPIVFNFHA